MITPLENKLKNILQTFFSILILGIFSVSLSLLLRPEKAQAAACTWQGDTNPAIWNDLAHWSCGHVPNNADTVTFASSNTNSATLDANVDVLGFSITTGYTGVITQNAGITVTIGASNYSQVAGTFTGGDSAITFNGTFSLTNAAGTFTATTGTTTFNKAYTHSAGTFAHNGGTVVYGGSTAYTVDVNANETYTNLQFNSTNASIITLGASDNLIVLGTLTMTNGYTNVGTINPRGTIDIQATFDGGSTALTIDANATADITIPDGATAPGITISNAARTISFDSGATAGIGALTMTNGTFNCSDTQTTFRGAFTHTVAAGTFSCTSGTAVFAGSASYTINVNATETFNALTFNPATAITFTISSGDTLVANSTVTLTKGIINAGTISAKADVTVNGLSGGTATLNMSSTAADQTLTWSSGTLCGLAINKTGYAATISGNLLAGALTVTAGTLNAGATTNTFSGAVTINGGVLNATTGTMSVAGNWARTSGTFTHNNGTVAFNAASSITQTVNSGGQNFYNVNHNGAGIMQLITNNFTADNNLNNSAGTLDLNGRNLTVSGTFTNSAALKLTGDETVSTPTLNAGSTVEYSATSGSRAIKSWTYTNATLKINGSGGTFSLPGAIDCVAVSVLAGTLSQGANTLTIGASGFTIFGGTFTADTTNITNSGNFTQSGGTYTGSSGNLANSGDFTLSGGTFTQSNGTISAVNFYQNNGTYNGGSNTMTFSGNFILSGGTFVSTSNTLAVAGNWEDCGGVFTHNSGTIDLNNSTDKTFSTFGLNTFNNITHSGSSQITYSMWKYRRLITIDHTKVPDVADPSTTYANFPVLISLSELSNINANGTDIRVTASDGTTFLPRQIESYSAGALTAWVRITLTKDAGDSSDDTFYMYYGNTFATEPAASSAYGSQSVWDSNFVAAWHLQESGNGTAGEYIDSTANNNGGQGGAGTVSYVPTQVDAKILKGQRFDGSNDTVRVFSSTSINSATGAGQTRTWSYWVNFTTVTENKLLTDKTGSFSGGGIWSEVHNSPANRICGGVAASPCLSTTSNLTAGTWNYVTFTYDGASTRVYLNGNLETGPTAQTAPADNALDFLFGGWSSYSTNGIMDELHISSNARSTSWINAEYTNQNSPSTFATKGDEISSSLLTTTISGDLINSSGTLAPGEFGINVGGNLNSTGGNITAGTSTINLNGLDAQNITSASQPFYNLTITNASAAGVTFTDSATVTGTFTAVTASTKLTFHALSTYAFANISINGQDSGTKISMISSDSANPDLPSRQWYFNVSQASPQATFVNVTDSDASGGEYYYSCYLN